MPVSRSKIPAAALAAILALGTASVAMLSAQQPTPQAPLFKDASRPLSERVADLPSARWFVC